MNVLHRANQHISRALAEWRAAHRKLAGSWQLTKQSLSTFRQHWKLLVGMVLVVLLPTSLLSAYLVDPTQDSSLSAYIAFANFIMSAAVIWTVAVIEHGKQTTAKQAYFRGSTILVRLLLLTVLAALMLLPLVFGLAVVTLGILEPGVALSAGEKALLGVLALILAWPSIAMLSRAAFSMYLLTDEGSGPLEAIRLSRRLVKGRLMPVLGRLLILLILLLVVLMIPVLITAVLAASGLQLVWVGVILQTLTGLFVLPFANIYLYKLYREIK